MSKKLIVFCVYDSKAEAYASPFFLQTSGLAVRSFIEAANDPQTDIHRYPADYSLFEIGTYCSDTGTLEAYAAKKNLGLALDLKRTNIVAEVKQLAPFASTKRLKSKKAKTA